MDKKDLFVETTAPNDIKDESCTKEEYNSNTSKNEAINAETEKYIQDELSLKEKMSSNMAKLKENEVLIYTGIEKKVNESYIVNWQNDLRKLQILAINLKNRGLK